MKVRRLTVGPETVRMVELGHPWVIADRYTRGWPPGKAGEVVELADGGGRLLGTALLDPEDRVVARLLAPGAVRLDAGWLAGRLERAFALRRDHADLAGTTAYRLVNGEGDGLPGVTIDRYDGHLMIQLYTAAWTPHLQALAEALGRVLSPKGIYWKPRPQQTRSLEGKKLSRLLAGSAVKGRMEVRENALAFGVDLEEGLHTGLFLDQRRNRRDLMARAKGKSVLNLFSYTGAFSVAAAAAGAQRVVSVDASPHYLEWSRDNFARNALDPKGHTCIQGDCFAVLEDLRRRKERFDIVLMDPPSFSTAGKSRFTTRQGTAELVAASLPLLPSGGLLITSSNHQKVDLPDYLKELRRGALQGGCELRVVQVAGQPEDFPFPVTFPEGRYLKYVIAAKS